jgi:hypothetical protein
MSLLGGKRTRQWAAAPQLMTKSGVADSFNYLVGSREQCRWHFKTEYLGSLEVDHKLVFGWRLHRQIRRLLALKNTIHV